MKSTIDLPFYHRTNEQIPHCTIQPKLLILQLRLINVYRHVWDKFYSLPAIWKRSACTPTLRARLAFVFINAVSPNV